MKPVSWHNFYNAVLTDPSILEVISYVYPNNWNQIGVRVRPNHDPVVVAQLIQSSLDATGGLVEC